MAKIVVVDDEQMVRDFLKQMLTRTGHRVTVANDGEEALTAVEQVKPDLVITDIIMPNKDGIQFMTELSKRHPTLPFIAISGGRRSVTAQFNLDSAELIGAKAVLTKPFTFEQLQAALSKAL
jgi:CheY-like chemotaxis protein